jgi:hypothetical protein
MFCIGSAGLPPRGLVGLDGSWLPPDRVPTDPEAAANWECVSVVPTTAAEMLIRLSVITHRHDVVAFIGSLQGFATQSPGARVLRNRLLNDVGMHLLGPPSSRLTDCEILPGTFPTCQPAAEIYLTTCLTARCCCASRGTTGTLTVNHASSALRPSEG